MIQFCIELECIEFRGFIIGTAKGKLLAHTKEIGKAATKSRVGTYKTPKTLKLRKKSKPIDLSVTSASIGMISPLTSQANHSFLATALNLPMMSLILF